MQKILCIFAVTLRVRVWIETQTDLFYHNHVNGVTLRVRVWIETLGVNTECTPTEVTLRVRVWIETYIRGNQSNGFFSHPPREGVD